MKLRMSTLQWRISVALTAVVFLFVTVQGTLAYLSVMHQEDELVNDIVMSETQRLVRRLANAEEPTLLAEHAMLMSSDMSAWLVPDGGSAQAVPTWLQGLGPGVHFEHFEDRRVMHAVIADTPSGRLYVEYDATDNEAFVYAFGGFLLLTGVAFVILGGLLSIWLARIVVAPIGRLARHLSDWSPSSSSPTTGTSDEETQLLQAFDQVQRRMDQAIAHEREFAANVRHEVRTPLSALRTDAELILLTEQALSPDARRRLHRIITSADSVAEAVEAAHALASSAPTQGEPVDLAGCVRSAWASLQHLNGDGRMQLRLDPALEAGGRPVLDRQALMTVLRNLLRNAIIHASPGLCEVRRTAHGITVADDGPGIAAGILPRIFDRYFTGRLVDTAGTAGGGDAHAPDHGLGLAIAEQIARQQHWSLGVDSTPGRGTTFTLDFE